MLAEREAVSFPDFQDAIANHNDVKISLCRQFLTLLSRNMVAVWRNPGSLLWRIFISVFVACFELASFW